jgi:hypothetical protein
LVQLVSFWRALGFSKATLSRLVESESQFFVKEHSSNTLPALEQNLLNRYFY